ncbi:MAG: HD-GYP domain-containing protein [Lachnospiraceae bacterium]|nr:HD-GYP domain-containing protein [Lachnospiraceae bacterium]
MRLVSIEMLQPEMKIARAVYNQGTLVLPEGRGNVAKYIPNLRNMGIEYVYVEDDKSQGIEIPDAIAERTRTSCKRILQNTIEQFSFTDKLETKELEACVNSVITEILNTPDIQVSLNDIASNDEYTYTHSVSTMVYSLMIARKLNYNKQKLTILGMGTLLHDIGKMLIDRDIMFKEGDLTRQEYEYVKMHSLYGYQTLRRIASLPEAARLIAYMHHERLDGSGYPQGLVADELNEYIRIVSIADVYDALTTDRCYRKKWPANKAMDFLVERSGKEFDPVLVGIFTQQLAVYPNGSLVRLSNGYYGIVSKQNRSMPLRPFVRVVQDPRGEDIIPYELDLMKELSVTITESELEINRNKPSVSPDEL